MKKNLRKQIMSFALASSLICTNVPTFADE